MKVRDVMTTPAFFVGENETAEKTAVLMKEKNVGAIPVCDKDGNILGIATDRDIVVRGIAEGKDPKNVTVGELMTKEITTISPFTSLDDAFDIMSDLQVRRLPVVEKKKLVGMLTMGDLSQAVEYSLEISDTLCEVCRDCEKA